MVNTRALIFENFVFCVRNMSCHVLHRGVLSEKYSLQCLYVGKELGH